MPQVEVSVGELFDKISILEIKRERFRDEDKRRNVIRELEELQKATAKLEHPPKIESIFEELGAVNRALWDIENEIRALEESKDFGAQFVEVARSVYLTNDRRAELKKELNKAFGSLLVEEKEYEGA